MKISAFKNALKGSLAAFAVLGAFAFAAPAYASVTVDCTVVDADTQECVMTSDATANIFAYWCRDDFMSGYGQSQTCSGNVEDTEYGSAHGVVCSGTGSQSGTCSTGSFCGCTGMSVGDTATFTYNFPAEGTNPPDTYAVQESDDTEFWAYGPYAVPFSPPPGPPMTEDEGIMYVALVVLVLTAGLARVYRSAFPKNV